MGDRKAFRGVVHRSSGGVAADFPWGGGCFSLGRRDRKTLRSVICTRCPRAGPGEIHRLYRLLGLEETRRIDNEAGRFTLVFLAPPGQPECRVELTYSWDGDDGLAERQAGIRAPAYDVENIYDMCAHLQANGVVINRPPRDGRMAFVRSPDNVSIELCRWAARCPPQNLGEHAQHGPLVRHARNDRQGEQRWAWKVFLARLVIARWPWLAGPLVTGYGFGVVGNIAVGIVGAFIASLLLPANRAVAGLGHRAAIVAFHDRGGGADDPDPAGEEGNLSARQ